MKCRSCNTEFEPMYRNGILVSKFCVKCLVVKGKAKIKKQNAKEKIEAKEKLKTISNFKNDLQPLINKIARLIDYGQPCIVTGLFDGKMNGGHFIGVGANDTIRFNLHNIHLQSEHSNKWKGGDNFRYRESLIQIYGIDYVNKITALNSIKSIKLTISDIKEKIIIARKIIKELESNLQINTISQRIELREKYNNELGIYKVFY